MKQHYDVRWVQNVFDWNLVDARGEAVSIVQHFYNEYGNTAWATLFADHETLAAAKRAAITRLMASTEEL